MLRILKGRLNQMTFLQFSFSLGTKISLNNFIRVIPITHGRWISFTLDTLQH